MMFGDEDSFQVSQEDCFNKQRTSHETSHRNNRTGPCPSCAHRSIPQQLKSEGVGEGFKSKCFAVCNNCYFWSVEAIKAADIQLNGQLGCLSQKPKRSKATILQSPLYCGEGRFLLDIFTGIVVGTVKLHLENLVVNTQDAVPEFHVGEAVMVAERTLRGAPNPEHGSAHILRRKLNDSLKWVYDVQFVAGGKRKEFNVSSSFLTFLDLDEAVKRPRRGSD
mmetsp:Transcript_35109/g.41382  ORF Transcript_35109/g.41382 Transcript_35109/m.41382 type:complete len:221 (+) Transcript_35109:353-1015(+)